MQSGGGRGTESLVGRVAARSRSGELPPPWVRPSRPPAGSSWSAKSAPPPGRSGPAAASRRLRLDFRGEWWIAIGAGLALVLYAVVAGAGLIVHSPSSPGAASAGAVSYDFPAVSYGNGLVARRAWAIAGPHVFLGTVGITNQGSSALTATVDEVIPKSVASSIDDLTFNPAPTAIVEPDPVVAYTVFLVPGANFVFTYGAEIDQAAVSTDDLRRWATQADNEVASLPAPPASSASLVQLTAPTSINVKPGQSTPLPAVQGKMSDGSAAPPAALNQVTWTSSNPGVAQVSGGNLIAVASGTITLTASLAGVQLAISVSVSVNLAAPPTPTSPANPPSTPKAGTSPPSAPAKVPVYEVHMPGGNYYFYSASTNELAIDKAEDNYQPVGQGPGGVGFYGCTGPSAIYVHRLVNYSTNLHEFTTSEAVVASYTSQGYTEESPNTFDGCPPSLPGVVPVYGLWLPGSGATRFTPSMSVVNQMVAAGWQDQGVAWYAYSP